MRIGTALAAFLLCAFAIFRGQDIVRFVEARAEVFSQPRRVEMLRRWVGTPGLTSLSLKTSLKAAGRARGVEGAKRRERDLTGLLSVRPLSARDWLRLAGLRLATGKPFKEILPALKMSWIAGPNEGSVMMERGIFGLLEWQALPKGARYRTIEDLAGAIDGGVTSDRQMALAKVLLAAKPQQQRLEIAKRLRIAGLSRSALSHIGL